MQKLVKNILDSGLLSTPVDLTEASATDDRSLFGRVLESYVYAELQKQASWAG